MPQKFWSRNVYVQDNNKSSTGNKLDTLAVGKFGRPILVEDTIRASRYIERQASHVPGGAWREYYPARWQMLSKLNIYLMVLPVVSQYRPCHNTVLWEQRIRFTDATVNAVMLQRKLASDFLLEPRLYAVADSSIVIGMQYGIDWIIYWKQNIFSNWSPRGW